MGNLECKKQCTICYNKECTKREAEPTLSEEEMKNRLKDLNEKADKFINSKEGKEVKSILRKYKSITEAPFVDRKRIIKLVERSGFNTSSVAMAVLITKLS